jgi:galactose-1-phosphate uridylyltransferase
LESSRSDCDFCENKYKENTADDIFGKIETDLSYTAANTFKYDKWHSLIISRNHNTLFLTQEETLDIFNLALTWFNKVNEIDITAKYPQIIWDAMPKSGASQVHTHLQASIGINNYYGGMRRVLDGSEKYFNDYKRNYIDDFIKIHKALGLTFKYNNTFVIMNLIPIKDQEIIIIGKNDKESFHTVSLLIHLITRKFIDDLEQYSISLIMYLPETFSSSSSYSSSLFDLNPKFKLVYNKKLDHILCRILYRSPVANLRSDINGLDLYTVSFFSFFILKVF